MKYSGINSPIRILHIVTQMNRAGLESRLMDIYRTLIGIVYNLTLHRQKMGSFDDEIKALGGKVYYNDPLI